MCSDSRSGQIDGRLVRKSLGLTREWSPSDRSIAATAAAGCLLDVADYCPDNIDTLRLPDRKAITSSHFKRSLYLWPNDFIWMALGWCLEWCSVNCPVNCVFTIGDTRCFVPGLDAFDLLPSSPAGFCHCPSTISFSWPSSDYLLVSDCSFSTWQFGCVCETPRVFDIWFVSLRCTFRSSRVAKGGSRTVRT